MGLVNITIDVDKDLYAALKLIADSEGITVDELASRVVTEALAKERADGN